MKTGDQITIKGITYIIEGIETEAAVSARYPNTGRIMRENKVLANLIVRRPNGDVLHLVVQTVHGLCYHLRLGRNSSANYLLPQEVI